MSGRSQVHALLFVTSHTWLLSHKENTQKHLLGSAGCSLQPAT